ncbi:MAG: MFS transporter [Rubrivivax sp.]|nr:MFS transporter [Rubrivivax sp.]
MRTPLPAGVWVLGFVSLLADVASEMVHSLLPLFLVGTLGVSMLAVGVIEGIAEATALIVKVFSGALSDRLGRRKGLAVAGYALGALTKPAFALATGAGMVIAARFVDRIGKGIRGAPRDALLADITPSGLRGAAFGLRQSLDTVGAVLGPLIATALMLAWANDIRAVFWVAVVPGLMAAALLWLGVREPPRPPTPASEATTGPSIHRAALARLGTGYWQIVGLGAVFTLARFSEAFLVLRAPQVGVAIAWVPLVMVAMNVVYAASAYPFGRLADTMSRRALLAGSLVLLIAADLVLAVAAGPGGLFIGVALWGVHMGLSQGILAAMVADSAPAELRGTAFGVFNLCAGVSMLAASVIAGWLWQSAGSAATFHAGAAFAGAALVWLLLARR